MPQRPCDVLNNYIYIFAYNYLYFNLFALVIKNNSKGMSGILIPNTSYFAI